MSSDVVKEALAKAFPETNADDWKRRSRKKAPTGVSRTFEHPDGRTVETIEKPNGAVDVVAGQRTIMVGTGIGPLLSLDEGKARLDAMMEFRPESSQLTIVPQAATVGAQRNQMVEGSIWSFSRELQLTMLVSNPERDKLIADRYRGTGWARDPEIAALPSCVLKHVMTIPAGARFMVVGKAITGERASANYDEKNITNGLCFPIRFETGTKLEVFHDRREGWRRFTTTDEFSGKLLLAPLKSIDRYIVPDSIPETLLYVMRDTATGKFFGGWEVVRTSSVYSGKTYYSSTQTDKPRMVDKFSSAKKYKTAAAVLASIRDFTGYANGLSDDDHGYRGEWVANTEADKKMDLPETWEGVSVNKATGEVKDVFDIQTKHRESLRLRGITAGHGSAVRAVYKKAEGKGFDAILVFQNRSRGSYEIRGEVRHYDDAEPWEELEDEGKAIFAAIDEALKAMSGQKMRVKTGAAIAVACSSLDGFAAVLAFDRDLSVDVKLLDWDNLKELTLPETTNA